MAETTNGQAASDSATILDVEHLANQAMRVSHDSRDEYDNSYYNLDKGKLIDWLNFGAAIPCGTVHIGCE